MIQFEFATATRIIFGVGALWDIIPQVADMGQHPLVVIGSSTLRAMPLLDSLARNKRKPMTFNVIGEPTIDTVRQGTYQAQRHRCDMVIGVGGGSVLDAGKAIAVLLTNHGDPLDYLEIIGNGQPLTQPAVPYIAIPTTAGTGAEVTRNAVLSSPDHQLKVSLRSPLMLPRLAVVDPELSQSMPPPVTASTGLDALTQVIEPYVSGQANPITDAFCIDGIHRAARSLLLAYQDSQHAAVSDDHNLEARIDMALTGLYGGLALANAKLGAVHGFAGPLGGMFDAPHGALCAALLPYVMAVNIKALQERDPYNEALYRYDEIAQIVTDSIDAKADNGVTWLQKLCQTLQIPPLGAYGITEADFPAIIKKANKASSMQGNPIKLTDSEMNDVLRRAS